LPVVGSSLDASQPFRRFVGPQKPAVAQPVAVELGFLGADVALEGANGVLL
jgi:hypothetical protein